jgi:hypothetical protein
MQLVGWKGNLAVRAHERVTPSWLLSISAMAAFPLASRAVARWIVECK